MEERQVQQLLRLTLQIKLQARIRRESEELGEVEEFPYQTAAQTDIAEAVAAEAEALEMVERPATADRAEADSAALRRTHER